jgi:hypothetical protein
MVEASREEGSASVLLSGAGAKEEGIPEGEVKLSKEGGGGRGDSGAEDIFGIDISSTLNSSGRGGGGGMSISGKDVRSGT